MLMAESIVGEEQTQQGKQRPQHACRLSNMSTMSDAVSPRLPSVSTCCFTATASFLRSAAALPLPLPLGVPPALAAGSRLVVSATDVAAGASAKSTLLTSSRTSSACTCTIHIHMFESWETMEHRAAGSTIRPPLVMLH